MSATEERKFIKDNTITKEEFIAQFENKSIEITVEGRYCWHKGNGPFLRFGKESLASFNYGVPWLNDPEGVVGEYGDIFWFCKISCCSGAGCYRYMARTFILKLVIR